MGCSGVLASGPSSAASQLSPRQPRHLPSSWEAQSPASAVQKGTILEAFPSLSASVKSTSQGPMHSAWNFPWEHSSRLQPHNYPGIICFNHRPLY